MQNSKSKEFNQKFNQQIQDIKLPDKISDKYTITSILKETDNKCVYIISDAKKELYILKICHGIFQSSLKQEYDVLCHAASCYFPEPVDFFKENDNSYLIRSYIRGKPLCDYTEQLFEKISDFTEFENTLIPLFIECCSIINILHSLKPPVIHRDIKEENFIFEASSGHPVLIDIDAGRQFMPNKSRDTVFAGTFGNAAPEQFGFGQSDVRTDIYGLGKTFISMLGGTEAANSHISPELSTILSKATAFEPENRYSSVKELIQELCSLKDTRMHKNKNIRLKRPLIFLFAGLLAGSAIGSGVGIIISRNIPISNMVQTQSQPKNDNPQDTSKTSQENNNSNNDDTANSSSDNNSSTKSMSDSNKKSVNDSLVDRAGVKSLNLFDFQDDVDSIILAAYDNDGDTLAKSIDTLISKLYKEPELTRNPPKDYSGYDHLPDSVINSSPMDIIRQRLVYRNHCLKKTIGSFNKYQSEILSLLRLVLYRTGDADESCIYKYSHSAKDKVDENDYYFCLSDLLDNIQLAIDNKDGFVRVYEQNQ